MARRRISLLLLGLGALGCGGGVPAPGFTTPFDKTSPESIRAYLSQLKFDHRDGAGDEERMVIGCPDACKPGPLVGIYPELRSYQNGYGQLEKGPGRIIATIINHDTLDYEPLNLRAGDTLYWAVDSVRRGERFSQGRSLYISARAMRDKEPSVVVANHPLVIQEHPDQKKLPMSLARWIYDSTGYADSTGHEGGYRDKQGGGSSELPWSVWAPKPIWAPMMWGNCKEGACCR